MKVVMTVVVRDEADVVDAHLAYHLNAGVDFVLATDHRSQDGTTEILETYARDGYIELFRETDEFIRQRAWQTRMSRLAATKYGADWIIPSDADEFWWPRGASLREALAAVPSGYGVVRALSRTFVPGRDDSGSFAERLTLRLAATAPINDPASTFRPVVKVAHRAHPAAVFPEGGAHDIFGLPWPTLRVSSPLEILHIPFRSREQCAWKYRRTWTGWRANPRGDLARARSLTEQGRAEAIWDHVSLDEAVTRRGLAEGVLVRDTRLRDALTVLGAAARGDSAASPGTGPGGASFSAENAAHAIDVALFEEAQLVRSYRRVDEIEARVARLERGRSVLRGALRSSTRDRDAT